MLWAAAVTVDHEHGFAVRAVGVVAVASCPWGGGHRHAGGCKWRCDLLLLLHQGAADGHGDARRRTREQQECQQGYKAASGNALPQWESHAEGRDSLQWSFG